MIPSIIIAIITIESAFNPIAVSHAGARGLMQLMPIGVKEAKIQCKLRGSDMNYWRTNLAHGTCLFNYYHKRQGNLATALMNYNGGYRQVNRYKRGQVLTRETLNYVYKVLKAKDAIDAKDCKLLHICSRYTSTNKFSLFGNHILPQTGQLPAPRNYQTQYSLPSYQRYQRAFKDKQGSMVAD